MVMAIRWICGLECDDDDVDVDGERILVLVWKNDVVDGLALARLLMYFDGVVV